MLRLLVRCLSLLPLPIRVIIGRFCGSLFSLFPTRDQKIGLLQLKLFGSDLTNGNERALVTQVYANLGQTIMESLNLDPILKRSANIISFPNLPIVKKLLENGKGVIALTAHTGNWDLMAAYSIANGLPLTSIGVKAEKESHQKILIELRERYGMKTIWRRDGGKELRELITALKENQIVGALIDQDTEVDGILLPFFGHLAKCPSGLVKLAKKYNAPIITSFIVRTKNGFTINVEPIDTALSVEEILTEYNSRLEKVIREYPDQWVWFHKRWRTLPSGEKLSSLKYLDFLKHMVRNVVAVLITITLTLSGCFSFQSQDYSELTKAEKLLHEKRYDEAIVSYEKHIRHRLSIKGRPEWENPYFHMLTIGDIYLMETRVDDALKAYQTAEDNGVEMPLIVDRLRYVASWYETRGELKEAIKFLQKYRDKDPELMDLTLDRLSKEVVRRENLKK